MSIWICVLLITVCAVCWDVGVVWQKQAADTLPKIEMGRKLFKIIKAFVSSRKWIGGLIISGLGWGLFAFALNYTPVSLARSIQGSGFVILAFFSIFFLHHRLKAWEWMGVIIVTAGIIALGFSEPIENETASVMIPSRLVPAVAAQQVTDYHFPVDWKAGRLVVHFPVVAVLQAANFHHLPA